MKRFALAALSIIALGAAIAYAQVVPPGTNPVPGAGAYNSSPPTCTAGQYCAMQTDVNGQLKVAGTFSASGGTVSNATSGQATTATNTGAVSYLYGFNGTTWDQLQVDASKFLKINCASGCAGGTFNNNADGVATSATNGQSAAWLYGFNGTTYDRLRADTTSGLWANVKSSVLPTGAATSALQSTINTTLGTPFQAGGSIGNTTFASTQSGAWNITNITGTITLPTLAATSTKQSDGSQKTQIVDGSGNVIASTSNNLNVQCANCSGSGASAVDEASFTAGTSVMAPAGGFFQTTATSNPLTTGQQGMWQMTANRAGFVNLRTAAGAETGIAAAPLQVSLANTASNATAVKVDGSAVTQPVSLTSTTLTGTSSVNTAQVNGVTTLTGTGAVGTGAQRIAVGTDTATIAGSAPGTAGAASANVVTIQGVASMTKLLVTPDSVALPANQSVNVAQMNGVTTTMGNGVAGTGVQRVAIASDNTAFSVNAVQSGTWNIGSITTLPALVAGTALIGKVGIDQTTPGTTNNVTVLSNTAPVSTMNSASANAGVTSANAYVFDDVSPTAITENSFGYARMSANRNTYTTLRDSAGNERGVTVNANNALNTSIDQTTVGTTNGVAVVASAINGSTTAGAIQPNNTTAVVVKASAGTLYGLQLGNIGSGPAYLKIYNATSATCGSGTPVKRLIIPKAGTAADGGGSNISFGSAGVAFGTGITYCVTTGIGDADTTAAAASTVLVNVDYK